MTQSMDLGGNSAHGKASRAWRLPRYTLEVRMDNSLMRRTGIIIAALLVGIALSVAILVFAGVPPGDLFSEFGYTIADAQSVFTVLKQAAPLMMVGLAASVAFRARFWNLGLEGQMVMGAMVATAISLGQLGPEAIRIHLMLLAAAIAGAFWVVLPLILKERLKVNEIIATLLLNYIAIYFMFHMLFGAWKDPRDSYPYSAELRPFERLADLPNGLNVAILLAVAVALLMLWLKHVSRFGFILKFVHDNATFARRVGLPVAVVTAAAVLLSGALAGIAGFVVTASIQGRLTQSFFAGYGFSGILIAFLARNNPVGVTIVAFLYAMVFVMGQNLQVFFQVPFAVIQLIQAIIVFVFAGSDFFLNYRLTRKA